MKSVWIEAHHDVFRVLPEGVVSWAHLANSHCLVANAATEPVAQSNVMLDIRVTTIYAQYMGCYGRPRILRELAQPIGRHERVRKRPRRQRIHPPSIGVLSGNDEIESS